MYFSQGRKAVPTTVRSKELKTFFAENFDVALQDQYVNNATMSLEYNFYDAYRENLANIEKLTGEKFRGFSENVGAYFDIASQIEGRDVDAGKIRQKTLDQFIQQEKKIEEIKSKYPDIKTAKEVWESVRENSRDIEDNAQDVSSRSTFGGSVGAFVGAVAGSFSVRDPFNLGTLNVGGFGRTLAQKVLTEVGAQSSIEAMNEFFGVRQNRELLGLDNSFGRTMSNIAFAGVGSGVIRGATEVAPAGVRSLSNSEALKKLKSKINKPNETARLAEDALEREIEFFDNQNPFGSDFEAEIEHRKRLKDAEEFLEYGSSDSLDRLNTIPNRTEEELNLEINKVNEEVFNYIESAKAIKEHLSKVSKIDLSKPSTLKDSLGYTPESLSDFIRRTGGIQDYSGELASRGLNKSSTNKPFKRGLIKDEKVSEATAQGVIKIDNQIDSVKQRVFDAGYFPNKTDYDEISDSELYDSIAKDLNSGPLYNSTDMENINAIIGDENIASRYDRIGISEDMEIEEIAMMLRDDDLYRNMDEIDTKYRITAQDAYNQQIAAREAEYLSSKEFELESSIDSRVSALSDMDGEIQIATGSRINENGEVELEYSKLKDLVDDIAENEELIKAAKGCVI